LSIQFALKVTACFALASFLTLPSAAQQTTPPSNPDSSAQTQPQAPTPGQPTPSGQQSQADKDKKGKGTSGQGTAAGTSAGTSNDRLFYALPNFLSLENGGKVPPLTTRQKFGVVARGTFDPVQFPWCFPVGH